MGKNLTPFTGPAASLNGVSRPVSRALQQVEARTLVTEAEIAADAYLTFGAMNLTSLLVEHGIVMIERNPQAGQAIALQIEGFAARSNMRLNRNI
jgi:hypothetical protein